MASILKVFAAVFLVVVALSGTGVSAQTHHVVGDDGGWGPALNITSWLSDRVFRVGDRIWFNYLGTGESIVELPGEEEFLSCNLTNPIRMYTDRVNHVALEKEGVRYFTSGNLESCKMGLKLPVPVEAASAFWPPMPVHDTPPAFGPPGPVVRPPPAHPPPSFEPPEPVVRPPPAHPPPSFEPPEPLHPPPAFAPPPPAPSAATHLNGLSLVVFALLLICYIGL